MNVTDFTATELDGMNLVGTLKGKTQKGKQRIKQWGGSGKILRVIDSIPASSERGLWFAISAGDPTWRWVKFNDDKDFDLSVDGWCGDTTTATHATTKGEV